MSESESTPRSDSAPQQPYAADSGQWQQQAPAHSAAFPQPPVHQPQPPVAHAPGVTVWPGTATAGGGGFGGGGTAVLTAPPAPAPIGGDAHRKPKKARRPIALFAAVALASGLIGGGTAALVGAATGGSTTTTTTATRVINASSSSSGVAAVAKAVSPAIVEITATSTSGEATGSGVVITGDGEIVTNNHVVTGASSIKVSFSDGKTATASVVGTDASKDLALIRAESVSGLTTATLGDSSGVAVGDQVVAIGSPEGLTGTVTSGIVSALDRDVTVATEESSGSGSNQSQGGGSGQWPFEFGGGQYNGNVGSSTTTYKAIQTDASLNPGNSGGALINMNGEIIGINSAMYSASSTSDTAGSVGLGFAIPVNTLKADLATLRKGGTSN